MNSDGVNVLGMRTYTHGRFGNCTTVIINQERGNEDAIIVFRKR